MVFEFDEHGNTHVVVPAEHDDKAASEFDADAMIEEIYGIGDTDGYLRWVIIGVDAEYTAKSESEVHVLSYQYHLITPDGEVHFGIHYTPSDRKSDRAKFDEFLVEILEGAFKAGVIKHYPALVYIATFFAKADLTHFSEFFKTLKTSVQSTRRTIASLTGDDGYAIDLKEVQSRHMNKASLYIPDPDIFEPQQVKVRFFDIMLLAPNGRNLDSVGQMLGLPKLSIPAPYSIERMDEYLKADKAGFC